MEREIDLNEISDGRLYDANDMVKADCQDCAGCSACCRGMGSSVLLDPYDFYRFKVGIGLNFESLMAEKRIELNVVDGIILPNLTMAGPGEACSFLDENGRCSIHDFRPGFCRLFPLGRLYENGSFRYFLQVHECRKENRTKVKVRKWIDTPDIKNYEKFVSDWHYFLKDLGRTVSQKPESAKAVSMYVLNRFFVNDYDASREFYGQFYERFTEGNAFKERL